MQMYSDNGGSRGLCTRLFRNCANGNGVEWMYAVDWAVGYDRWFGFSMRTGLSIESMIDDGWELRRWNA